MLKISLCMIVKNEATHLDRCLQSVKGLATEIIVVDTGSSDATVDIARSHGAEVHFFEWCDDFSLARNAAIEKAQGDWVLLLDGDEWLPDDAAETWPSILSDPQFEGAVVLNAQVGPPEDATVFKRLLFRNHQHLRFVGKVHEKLELLSAEQSGEQSGEPKRFDCFPLRVFHQPLSQDAAQTKALWYLALIKSEFKQTGLSWARQAELWQHQADAEETLGKKEVALSSLQTAWRCYEQSFLPESDLFGTFLLSRLILLELQTEAPELQSHILALLKRAPERFEGWFFQAYSLLLLGQSNLGMAPLKEALLRRKHLQPLWQFRLDLLLARYSLLQGASQQGEEILLRLLALAPQAELVWHLLRASLLTNMALTSDTDRLWQSLGERKPPQPRLQAQRLLREGLWSPEERRSLVRLGKGFKG
ncbi:MAG: glycosyltransferase family 2 protein [Candidatus Sericytochromatia bacterium]|nr:glycosyltransferase family 2 protein [Candidatus Sericytochromatia bacterium]